MSKNCDCSISTYALERGVEEILHFSTNRGLTGCLHTGYLLPRPKLRKEETLTHILTLNAPFRTEEAESFDKSEDWINYVNLSISEITTNLFRASLKWHSGKDIYWVIMSFDPKILDHKGVYFSTTNSIYNGTQRGKGLEGFRALFAERVLRRNTWYANRRNRAEHLPTCEQAEVLYPGGLSMSFLRRIYVREDEEADAVHALLGQFDRLDVKVAPSPEKFAGQQN
jgi:hypothetical protein